MADAEAVMAEVRDDPRLRSIGLVLNRRGLDRAIAAGCHEATVVVVVSDGLALKNQGVDTAAQVAAWQAMADDARSAGLADDGDPGGRVRLPLRRRGLDRAGARGRARRARRRPRRARDRGHDRRRRTRPGALDRRRPAGSSTPTIPLRAHFHNTRNTGYANALAAVESGVTVLDASAGGIGGCPFAPGATGNIATEDLTYLLSRSGIETGIDLASMAATGTWISDLVGYPQAPAMLGRAGWFP